MKRSQKPPSIPGTIKKPISFNDLTDIQRVAIKDLYDDGMTLAEVVVATGLPRGAVEKTLRGYKRVKVDA